MSDAAADAPAFLRKIVAREQAAQALRRLPGPVVFTNGVFDVLHRGHVTYLAQARALGGSLVVAINTDASARRLGKGPERPLNNEQEVTFSYPERLYDMNLRADVPSDSFLVVAPSEEARWKTSIGNNFFVNDGTAERMENVLLIVPRGVRIEEVLSQRTAGK